MTAVRTRFAPSPTGYLHIGGARTALFNYLYARKMGGVFVLRIEDTDKARNTEEATQAIFDGMEWLGLDWDEGPKVGGEYGPYYQSQRDDIYDRYFQKLVDAGRVYQDGDAWRFRFTRDGVMTLHDLICGDISVDYQDESNTPDMVIKRSDGSYVFHLVNVVDDIEMKITHVIRGEDHIMNTFKHIQLFEALGEDVPAYGHMPLILNPDGSKMSKRDVGAALSTYPAEGFYPEGVMNFLALLGWSPKDDTEVFSPAELIERFSLEAINRSAAKFDIVKCKWINQQHLAQISIEEFITAAKPFCLAAGMTDGERLEAAIATTQHKVQILSEVPEKIKFIEVLTMDDEALAKVKAGIGPILGKLAQEIAQQATWDAATAVEAIKTVAGAEKVRPGAIMFPTRVALSGLSGGPDLEDIFKLLGKEESLRRLEKAAAEWV